MYKVFLVYILMVFACSLHPKEQANVLYAKDLYPYGRSEITTDNTLNLISSAVHFGFTFQGKTCTIYTSLPSWLAARIEYPPPGHIITAVPLSDG